MVRSGFAENILESVVLPVFKISLLAILVFLPLLLPAFCISANLNSIYAEGLKLFQKKDYMSAMKIWEQGFDLARQQDKIQHAVNFCNGIGFLKHQLERYEDALLTYHDCLSISDTGQYREEAMVHMNLGNTYRRLALYAQSVEEFNEVLKYTQATNDYELMAKTFNNKGLVLMIQGYLEEAIENFEESIKVKKILGDKRGIAISEQNVAIANRNLGEYDTSISFYEKSLKSHKINGDQFGEFSILNNLAVLYANTGDYKKSKEYLDQAATLRQPLELKRNRGMLYNNYSTYYALIGNTDESIRYLKKSIKLAEETGDKHSLAGGYQNLGTLYEDLGENSLAIEYLDKAKDIAITIGVAELVTLIESNTGYLLLKTGESEKAKSIFENLNNHQGLGMYYLVKSKYLSAIESFNIALKASTGDIYSLPFEIAATIGLGKAYEGLNELDKATGYYKRACALVDEQWNTVDAASRRTFLTGSSGVSGIKRLEAYEGLLRTTVELRKPGFEQQTLQDVERIKSRSLLQALAAKIPDKGNSRLSIIIKKDREFQQRLSRHREQLDRLISNGIMPDDEKFVTVKNKHNKTIREYEKFINEVKLNDTEESRLISVQTLDVTQLQKRLGQDTTLVEFYTANDAIYTWVITDSSIVLNKLDVNESDLERLVNELLMPGLSENTRRPSPAITKSLTKTNELSVQGDYKENRVRFLTHLREMDRHLFEPIRNLCKTENLIFIPHGVLHKLPFAALFDGNSYLVEKYNISVLPAAGVYKYLSKKRNKNNGRLLAFENPDTESDPLLFTEIEVGAIERLFPENRVFRKEQATETTARNKMPEADVIHFATHGEFNDKQPMQSGLLLAKDDLNDGYLQVHEIFDLDLSETNLVTLSACETALTKVQGGDDLVGLSQGFIYAGTPSILATLWKVDDKSTALLMSSFYKNWREKRMSKSKALREAQLSLLNVEGMEHPYYWAPFTLIGDVVH